MSISRVVRSQLLVVVLILTPCTLTLAQISPVNLTNWSIGDGCNSAAKLSHYLYLGNNDNVFGGSGLTILNVTDPAHPTDVGYSDEAEYSYVRALSGNYIYTDRGIMDISNPTNPVTVGAIDQGDVVAVSGGLAYTAGGSGLSDYWVLLYDISNPASPARLGQINTPQIAVVATSGKYAYLGVLWNGLFVADVSDPVNPRIVGHESSPRFSLDVTVAGNYVYVADLTNGFWIYDISNRTNPVPVSHVFDGVSIDAQVVRVSGNYAYTVDNRRARFQVWDVSNPTNVSLAATVGSPAYPYSIAVSGNDAYLAHQDGVSIYSLGIPSPSLSIATALNDTLSLSWPAPTGGYRVQQNLDLTAPNWITLANVPGVVSSRNQVTIPMQHGKMFYRLVADQ